MPKPPSSDKNNRGDKRMMSAETGSSAEPVLSFEDSMTELQQIVNDLEDNSLGLEASLAGFERGIGLLRDCHSFLERAEQKIEILVSFKEGGESVTAPFDATPTASNSDSKTLF